MRKGFPSPNLNTMKRVPIIHSTVNIGQVRRKTIPWWNSWEMKKFSALVTLVFVCTRILSSSAGPVSGFASNEEQANFLCNGEKRRDELCLTQGCVKWAAAVLDKMDASVDPCDNFYGFACGNFIKEIVIPDAKTEVDAFSVLQDKLQLQLRAAFEEPIRDGELELFKTVKRFYGDCKDRDQIEKLGLEVVKDKIRKNGGWPLLEQQNWNASEFDLGKLLHGFLKYGYNSNPLVTLSVETDLRNSSKRTIYIGVGAFGLGKEFLKKGTKDKVVKAYRDFMVETVTAFGANPRIVGGEMRDVLALEISLANHTLSNEERRNVTRIYNNATIAELQVRYPSVSWLKFINNVLPKKVQVTSSEVVVATEPKYLEFLDKILKNTPKKILANYVIWHVVLASTDALNKNIEDIKFKLKQAVYGIKAMPSRWENCIYHVKPMLANIVGAMYVRKYFSRKSKNEILNTLEYLQREFEKILEQNDWMDEETRRAALKKFKAMKHHIAYPEELYDDAVLTNAYEKLELLPGEFLNSALRINRFNLINRNKRLREPVNKTEWVSHADTATVNAFFNQVENALRFPAGILQDQFFDLNRPRYMNFGAFGSIIGHEMTHGFDDVGRQFDSEGNLKEWWREGTKKAFLKKVNCFIDQYGSYRIAEINMTINGKLTQGENIADNGGVKEAYQAYQTWKAENHPEPLLPGVNYTQNQMFWISFAQNWCYKATRERMRVHVIRDIHTTAEFRVIGSVSNMKEFAEDFGCPLGSPMNPNHKCKVW